MEQIIQIIINVIIFSGAGAFITMCVLHVVFGLLLLRTIKKTKKLATILSLLSCINPICGVVMADSPSNDNDEVFSRLFVLGGWRAWTRLSNV